MSENENVTKIADLLNDANIDLRVVVTRLEEAAILMRDVSGFESDVTVANIASLVRTLSHQLELQSFVWNTVDDDRN